MRLGRTGLLGRLLVVAVPQEAADQRRRRMQKDARDTGQAVSALHKSATTSVLGTEELVSAQRKLIPL